LREAEGNDDPTSKQNHHRVVDQGTQNSGPLDGRTPVEHQRPAIATSGLNAMPPHTNAIDRTKERFRLAANSQQHQTNMTPASFTARIKARFISLVEQSPCIRVSDAGWVATSWPILGNLQVGKQECCNGFRLFCYSIGLSDFILFAFVLVESLVPRCSAALGPALAGIAMPVVAKLVNGSFANVAASSQVLLVGLLMALLFGMISGLIPGINAMRLRVIKSSVLLHCLD
jgi:hypothetical protein